MSNMSKERTPAVALSVAFFVFSAAMLVPTLASAHSTLVDDQFDCTSDPHTFISTLIDNKSIGPKPSRVEANSVNAYRPVEGNRLRAFGLPIYAVFGFARDDTLFARGSGKDPSDPVYGVVVSAPATTVRERLREHHSDAQVKAVVPLVLTAIVCEHAERQPQASE